MLHFFSILTLFLNYHKVSNTIAGLTYLLVRFLSQKLKPLVGHTDSFLKDSGSFIQKWKDVRLEPRDLLFFFFSLYTKIPTQETTDIIKQISDKDTTKLVCFCLTLTFFSFQGEFYVKTCGVSMGYHLSPIVSNLFMEYMRPRP